MVSNAVRWAVGWCAWLAIISILLVSGAQATDPGMSEEAPMTFSWVRGCLYTDVCPSFLLAQGDMEMRSAKLLDDALAARPDGVDDPVWVALDSDGGNLLAGLLLGQRLRHHQANAIVHGHLMVTPLSGPAIDGPISSRCYSSCAYAMAGGVVRDVVAGGQVGVHRFEALDAQGLGDASAQIAVSQIALHLNQLGVSTDLVIMANLVATDTIVHLTRRDLEATGMINAASVFNGWRLIARAEDGTLVLSATAKQSRSQRTIHMYLGWAGNTVILSVFHTGLARVRALAATQSWNQEQATMIWCSEACLEWASHEPWQFMPRGDAVHTSFRVSSADLVDWLAMVDPDDDLSIHGTGILPELTVPTIGLRAALAALQRQSAR